MERKIQCLIVDDEAIAREIIETHLRKIPVAEIAGKCKNAVEAFRIVNTQQIDLIFLDINMPEISGLSFAKSVPPNTKIIFTTAYREYAIDGFDLRAVDYLLKPISFERLLKSVQNYLELNDKPAQSAPTKNQDFIFVRSDRKMVKVKLDELHYVESLKDYLKIHLADRFIVTRETISGLVDRLPKNSFLRIHRSFVVNLSHIDAYTNESVEINKTVLPISRQYKQEVSDFLNDSVSSH
ncbi:DNA-binding response regulator (plasmid) [Fulvitalea axinellae]|uniref:DNA-binding response regulator n=1 Tax=Fulvitalea axinellae TaxID=1182444 RepID=A0AAU9CTK0_9BACT|nr:DNA-binding response regulator [Fulvitalea axinellae]